MKTGPVIAGNWKMHMTPDETRAFFQEFSFSPSAAKDPQFLIFPPYLSLGAALEARPAHLLMSVGVQNLYWEATGAFTGEISAPMARAAGATHTLIGHSERRHVFGESNEEVAWKVSAALDAGLVPVVCVGETLEERREGRLEEVILGQLNAFITLLEENP